MANKHNGEVSVEIDGNEYTIKLKADHFATAEGILGVDSLIGRQLGFRSVQALFYLACQGQHGLSKIAAVSDMMDKYMTILTNAVGEAVDFFYQNQVTLIED